MIKFTSEQLEDYNRGYLYGCFGIACNYTRTFVECPILKFKKIPTTCAISGNSISAKFENDTNILPLLALYFISNKTVDDGYFFEGNDIFLNGLIDIKNIKISEENIVFGDLFQSGNFLKNVSLNYLKGWPKKKIDPIAYEGTAVVPPEKLIYACYNKPSIGFGEMLKAYDDGTHLPRLPSPPILAVTAIISYDETHLKNVFVIKNDSYKDYLPFVIYIESALQPCGWLSCVSVLNDFKQPMYFRNLEGKVTHLKPIYTNKNQKIFYDIKLDQKVRFGNTMVLGFVVEGFIENESVIKLETKFGFYTEQALQKQSGFKNIEMPKIDAYQPVIKTTGAMPFSMVDDVLHCNHSMIIGRRMVTPDDWYFKSHFFQDPVQPGSLGLEGLIECALIWAKNQLDLDNLIYGGAMTWKYRGQVLPSNSEVKYVVKMLENKNNETIKFEGLLFVDDVCIYHFEEFYLNNK